MGRVRKQTAEYFPHFVNEGRTIFILEKKWGNDGYAFWFKLLEVLCKRDGHYYSCEQTVDAEYLASNASVDVDTANAILDLLAGMGNIDKALWEQRKIIWCQALVDNLASLYAKRATGLPTKPSLDAEIVQMEPKKAQTEAKPVEVKEDKDEPKKPPAKPPKPEKKRYAEFVTLTEAEYEKLVSQYGEERTRLFIQRLDNYKGANGKKYASDYRAILNWVVEQVNEDLTRKGSVSRGNDARFGNPQPTAFEPSTGFRNGGT